MITEETIKQTKFYRGVNEKVYLVLNVKQVKIVTLVDCIEGSESDMILGDDVCSQFDPVDASFKVLVPNQVATDIPKKPKLGGRKKPSRARGGKAPSSQFKGVREDKRGYKDGRKKYVVIYHNTKTGKIEYLGTFDNEYLAAAMYEKRAGNPEEAQRLRNMAEQANNNPDRQSHNNCKKKIWVCKRCGLGYQSPGVCASCGNNDMREVEQ